MLLPFAPKPCLDLSCSLYFRGLPQVLPIPTLIALLFPQPFQTFPPSISALPLVGSQRPAAQDDLELPQPVVMEMTGVGPFLPCCVTYSPEIRESPIFYPPSVFSPLPQGKKKKEKKNPRTKGWKPRHPLLLQLWPRRVSLGAKEARKRSLFLKQAMFILVA